VGAPPAMMMPTRPINTQAILAILGSAHLAITFFMAFLQ
jgi:hypothetical protein